MGPLQCQFGGPLVACCCGEERNKPAFPTTRYDLRLRRRRRRLRQRLSCSQPASPTFSWVCVNIKFCNRARDSHAVNEPVGARSLVWRGRTLRGGWLGVRGGRVLWLMWLIMFFQLLFRRLFVYFSVFEVDFGWLICEYICMRNGRVLTGEKYKIAERGYFWDLVCVWARTRMSEVMCGNNKL